MARNAAEHAACIAADGDRVIASRDDLEAALDSMARAIGWSSSPDCLASGKSLYIRELARVAHAMGRTVHSLQWDVARPAFVSPAIAARYPDRDGIAHPIVRKGVGQWVRQAVLRWHRRNAGDAQPADRRGAVDRPPARGAGAGACG